MVPVFLSEGKFILATLIGYYQVVSSEFKVDISLFRQPSQNKGQILSVDSQVKLVQKTWQFNNQVFCTNFTGFPQNTSDFQQRIIKFLLVHSSPFKS